jgi:TRAP-type mannitol/chloroaromatic compound transport system substrate-binding protein
MRIPGIGGEVMSAMGVTVTLMAGGEIYQSLERGAIDAAEWVGPYDDVKLGFHEIADFYHYPGWWEPGPNVSFMVNRQAWDNLPSLYQQAFETAAAEANLRVLSRYDARNQGALKEVIEAGVRLERFPTEFMREAERVATDLIETQAASSPQYRKVYDSFLKWREDSFRWFGTAEHAFASFAFPNAGPRSET